METSQAIMTVLPLVFLLCFGFTNGDDTMDKLQREMLEKLMEEHGVDTPEGEEELRSLIKGAQTIETDVSDKANLEKNKPDDSKDAVQTEMDMPEQVHTTSQTGGVFESMANFGGFQVFGGDDEGWQTYGDFGDSNTASHGNVDNDQSEEFHCDEDGLSGDGQCNPRSHYEEDISMLKSQVAGLQQSLRACVPKDQYTREISELKAQLKSQGGGGGGGGSDVRLTQQLGSLQESLQHVGRKLHSYDNKIQDLTTSVTAINDNYARNTVRKCESGSFSGCECSKCCSGANSWNCDGRKEIYFTESFHKPPALTITVSSLKKTKNINHPVIFSDVKKGSFILQYLPKDNFVDLDEVQVNWIACA